MKSFTLLACAVAITSAVALPAEEAYTPKTPHACRGGIVEVLRHDPTARGFCSSFLRATGTENIDRPGKTVTVKTTLAPSEITKTVTSTTTTTVTAQSSAVKSTTITSFTAGTATCASSAGYLPGTISGDNLLKRAEITSPLPTPTELGGQASAFVSSVCSCMHLNFREKTSRVHSENSATTVTKTITPTGAKHTSTTTTCVTSTITKTTSGAIATTTSTVYLIQPTPTTFSGLNWYAYSNDYDFTGTPDIDVTDFMSDEYEDSGSVENVVDIAPGNDATCSMPGSSDKLDCVYITVVMQGYFYASMSGTYTMTTNGSDATSVDNYVGLWTGTTAYNKWNNNNADFIAIRENYSSVQRGGTATYVLEEGELLPVTIIYMNGGYQGNFQFMVITPDGVQHPDTTGFWVPACESQGSYDDPFSP